MRHIQKKVSDNSSVRLLQTDTDQPLSRPTRDVQAAVASKSSSSAESPLNNRFLMRPTREVKPVNNDFLMRPM